MNEIVDHSMICPCAEMLHNVIMLITKILLIFQKEFKQVVEEAEDMEIQIFCALTNSNIKFMSLLKTFIHKISKFGIKCEMEISKVVLIYLGYPS